MTKAFARTLLAALALSPAAAAVANDWPGWRGPAGTGVAAEPNLPTEWSREKNVRWRVDLPGPGNASPVVHKDKVFVAQAVADGNRRTLMCFDRATGKLLWQSGVAYADKEPTHDTNPYCSGTPATDGERVYVCFGSAGVFAYDLAGKEVWRRDLGKLAHMFGNAVSPVLHGDLVILNYGPDDAKARLVALKKSTGEVAWEARPPKAEPAKPDVADGKGGKPPRPGSFGMGIMIAAQFLQDGDANRDEELSKAEFVGLADKWFGKLDSAKAGRLTREQFAGRLDGVLPTPAGMGNAPPPKPGDPPPAFTPGTIVGPGLFDAADANKDKSLTREEFAGSAAKWAAEWDSDKNGTLDEAEVREGLNATLPPFQFPGGPPPAGGPPSGQPAGGPPADGPPPGGMSGVPTGSWATPVVIKADGRDELVVGFANLLAAYDPATGKLLWTCKGISSQVYTSALVAGDLVIALGSGIEGGSAIAVRPGGTGDVTADRRAWRADRVKGAIGSGVVHAGRFFHAGADGVVECLDAKTGKKLWQKRLAATAGQSGVWASLLLAGDRIYAANQSGDVFVLKAGPKFDLLATNSVNEPTNASPAASDGELFLRTDKSLWCVGGPR